ncbi:MAG: ATP-binding cassette domain-containing protein [Paracoccaceae bacterium]|nr:ATP-binding cassette domain-containing protein [Paracoccaceae bacterium]
MFRDIRLDVAAGQWTCLLGASGVGKSTILKIFSGLNDEIVLNGTVSASDGGLTNRVTLMAQDDMLLPWLSAQNNVLLGARLRGERPDAARSRAMLAKVGLVGKAASRPRALSGGQRQRVALARTLMEDRPVVLLDEPFSALDALTRARMQELSAELLSNRTVLLVTHDPGEAARLGHAIKVMTPAGIEDFAQPNGTVPRPMDDIGVLTTQARLYSRLCRPS